MLFRQTKLTKKIAHLAGDAIARYGMIKDGDRIIAAVSGGKDSMSMLYFLKFFQSVAPVRFEFFPVYIDPGFEPSFREDLKSFLATKGLDLYCEKTDYGIVAHSPENSENPCFLCSRLRRKRLFELADEWDCYKLALGHTRDDIIETFFINICYTGEISTMVPAQPMFRNQFTIIRPLAFVDETMTENFRSEAGMPEFINPCPSDGFTKREELKSFLKTMYSLDPRIKSNVFRSLSRIKSEYMPDFT